MYTTNRYLLAPALLFALSIPLISHGALFQAGSVFSIDATNDADGDLYLAGEHVSVYGTTTGDVFLAAGAADISGVVEGDVMSAGRSLYSRALVGGDIRLAGEEVRVAGNVGEDVILFGSSVTIEEGTHIAGDVLIRAEYAKVLGTVDGDIDIAAENAVIGCTCEGVALLKTRTSLSLESGTILGNVRYSAPREIMVPDTVTILGELSYEPFVASKKEDKSAIPGFMFKILLSFISGLVVYFLFPSLARSVSARALSNNGTFALIGFAVLVCTPMLALLVAVTLLGVMPAILLFLVYASALVLTGALTPILAGAGIAVWLKKGDGMRWYWVGIGAVVLLLLTLVPVIGWIVRALVYLTALGALAVLAYDHVWKHRKTSTESMSPATPQDASDHEEGQKETETTQETQAKE